MDDFYWELMEAAEDATRAGDSDRAERLYADAHEYAMDLVPVLSPDRLDPAHDAPVPHLARAC